MYNLSHLGSVVIHPPMCNIAKKGVTQHSVVVLLPKPDQLLHIPPPAGSLLQCCFQYAICTVELLS